MMKSAFLLVALTALPLMAQEPQSPENDSVKCSKCGNPMTAQCPQASVAAAVGFQKGFHMGFETGFAQAARMMKGCPNCKDGKSCGPKGPHGRPAPQAAPNQAAPAPRPEAPAPAEPDMM